MEGVAAFPDSAARLANEFGQCVERAISQALPPASPAGGDLSPNQCAKLPPCCRTPARLACPCPDEPPEPPIAPIVRRGMPMGRAECAAR
jgi:hypothetical protein